MGKKVLSLLLALTLCMATSITAFAEDLDTPAEEPIVSEYMGYNGGTGYVGSFTVYVPGSANTGQVSVRIYASAQNVPIWLKVTKPNGQVVWDCGSDWGVNPLNCLYPNNGNEQYSPTFSNATSGYYTVEWVAWDDITLDCWIYNW